MERWVEASPLSGLTVEFFRMEMSATIAFQCEMCRGDSYLN